MPACDTCYRRKVRCKSEPGISCSACVRKGTNCTFVHAEQHKAKRRTKRPHCPEDGVSKNSPDPQSPQTIVEPSSPQANPTSEDLGKSRDYDRPPPLIPTEADVADERLAKTALTRFYHHSINASTWTVFDETSNVRIAYVGTPASNLAALVNQEAKFSNSHAASLHFPFPSIRPVVPWKPANSLPLVKWYSTSFADDISALPVKHIRDDLVDSFFAHIHPGFPVVDESQFRAQYNDLNNPPPLLLLQAVLLVGAHVSNHAKVARSRSLVKMALFRRAKALFDLHYENDRMHLVQAALLFTWHCEGADDVSSNVYYWVGIACRIAFGLGMHRDLSHTAVNNMPPADRHIYRRIFWTLFQVDTFASLNHGRPMSIDLEEVDQPSLCADDFIESGQDLNESVNIGFCIQNTALCKILASVIKMFCPGSLRRFCTNPGSFSLTRANIDSKLAGWYLRLPSNLANFTKPGADFWSLQLQLHYNLALLHLHRVPDATYVSLSAAEDRTSTEICHTVALSISKLFDEISTRYNVGQCWFTALTTLLAAAIQMSHEARSAAAANTTVLAIQVQNHLESLLPVIRAVSKYWCGAEAILHLYKDLLRQLRQQTQSTFDLREQTHASYELPSLLGKSDIGMSPSQRDSRIDHTHRLGSVEHLGDDWRTLFGAGQSGNFPDTGYAALDEWLTLPMNQFCGQADLSGSSIPY